MGHSLLTPVLDCCSFLTFFSSFSQILKYLLNVFLVCLEIFEHKVPVLHLSTWFPWFYLYEVMCVSCPELTGIVQQIWIKGTLATVDAFHVRRQTRKAVTWGYISWLGHTAPWCLLFNAIWAPISFSLSLELTGEGELGNLLLLDQFFFFFWLVDQF